MPAIARDLFGQFPTQIVRDLLDTFVERKRFVLRELPVQHRRIEWAVERLDTRDGFGVEQRQDHLHRPSCAKDVLHTWKLA